MAQRTTLTEQQVGVLRWIEGGCPAESNPGTAPNGERISAAALRNRGLVVIRGRGPEWSAVITDKGRDYLALVDGPNPPLPRAPNRPATPRLIDEIIAAGGTLRVRLDGQRRGEEAKVDYERRVLLAEQRGDVPPGKRFVLTRAWPELHIELCDGPPGAPIEPTPVPVPERVHKFHPLVKAFREQVERHEVSAEQLPRVCRILQGLVVEAERRGHIVDLSPSSTVARMNRPRWSAASDGHLRLAVSGYVVVLRIREDRIGQRHNAPVPGARPGTTRRRVQAPRGNGTVRMWIVSPYSASSRQSSWADGKSRRLEELLPSLLMHVELRAAEMREQAAAAHEQKLRERAQWEEAKNRAAERYTEQLRADALDDQVARWKRAADIRTYCDALARARTADAETEQWVAWARQHADEIDPLGGLFTLPTVPSSIDPKLIEPFLDGWSPHAPIRTASFSRRR